MTGTDRPAPCPCSLGQGAGPAHHTTLGHLPETAATSWACTCGAARVATYRPSAGPDLALRLAAARAAAHQRTAALTQALET